MLSQIIGMFIGVRKFVIMLLFMIIMVVFRIMDYINGSEFANNLQMAVVAFIASNLGEHFIGIARTWIDTKVDKITGEDKPETDA
jgi:hypothetical protein